MAQSAAPKNRPLSPHLQVWRWGPAMFVSILHRVTGDGMALVGLPVLLWWLAALAGGPDSYAVFQGQAETWYGQVVLIGLTWAFFNHLVSGLRHFVLDTGAGFELKSNNRWSAAAPLIGIVLTGLFWAALCYA
jgi:succinate dehydrogenase / fumarate reductase cytochrome b subunit